ncbi:MAG: hypothetical protein IPL52_17290 [Flavobacteriales bacterium]|nr:hypothetical protein [Flavobacteriales bacterium]
MRNKLMLVAPSVTIDGWRAALITRTPAMNPWHLAQALLANSPLQQEVLDMVESLPIDPFYKELVYGGQSGVSMYSIYQSEIAHFYAAKATALQAMVRKSLLSGDAGDIALTHARLTASKSVGEHEAHLALYLAEGDLTSARTLVNNRKCASHAGGLPQPEQRPGIFGVPSTRRRGTSRSVGERHARAPREARADRSQGWHLGNSAQGACHRRAYRLALLRWDTSGHGQVELDAIA